MPEQMTKIYKTNPNSGKAGSLFPHSAFMKRLFDLFICFIAGLILLPFFIVITFAVRITSRGPALYWSDRVGLCNTIFKMPKFRTMQVSTPAVATHLLADPDQYLTPIGSFLRKTSLDELPQLWSIMKGDMSFVGPRPALPREVSIYNSIYERRLIAKPGITGPWQISGRSDLDLRTSVALDLNYLINWSFTRDLWIIVSTVGAVFKGKGAY